MTTILSPSLERHATTAQTLSDRVQRATGNGIAGLSVNICDGVVELRGNCRSFTVLKWAQDVVLAERNMDGPPLRVQNRIQVV